MGIMFTQHMIPQPKHNLCNYLIINNFENGYLSRSNLVSFRR